MATPDVSAPRRRGRPPATDSATTRANIFDAARRLFAERGYSAVTNKDLAAAAGITTGALYHYVESKLDLYAEVYAGVQARYYSRFQEAIDQSSGFVGKLESVFDAAIELAHEDPSLAKFVGTLRSDSRRHPEVAERLADGLAERERFFSALVEVGVATGEVADGDQALVREYIRLLMVGIIENASNSLDAQQTAIDAVKAMLHGELIRPPG